MTQYITSIGLFYKN